MKFRSAARLVLVSGISVIGFSGGCGYSLGYRAPPSVRSIAVPMFNNNTFPLRAGAEYELTSAFRQEIQNRTSLRLVSSEEADMVVYGTISQFREQPIAEGRRDEKLESNIRVTVDLVVEDRVNGERWSERVSKTEPFSIARGETIDLARKRAIENLSEKILIAIEHW